MLKFLSFLFVFAEVMIMLLFFCHRIGGYRSYTAAAYNNYKMRTPIAGPAYQYFSSLSSIDATTTNTAISHTDSQTDKDIRFMRLALRLAQHAYREKEVPIGAVVVDQDGNVVSTGRNQVEERQDATAHAEVNALREASRYQNNWRLINCTLYTTLEPCMICLGAAQNFRISRIVYAAKDIRVGACGSWQSLHDVKHPIHHIVDVSGGVCEEESAVLLKRFFSALRTEKFRYPGYDLGRGISDSIV